MRIIKLSTEIFTERNVQAFFRTELYQRDMPGKFRLPFGWIDPDRFSEGEKVVFTYETIPIYSAVAKTGIHENIDDESQEYPLYFLIDMPTLRPVNDGESARELLRDFTKGQAWNFIEDSAHADGIWATLRETSAT